jgi:hypothetical protein
VDFLGNQTTKLASQIFSQAEITKKLCQTFYQEKLNKSSQLALCLIKSGNKKNLHYFLKQVHQEMLLTKKLKMKRVKAAILKKTNLNQKPNNQKAQFLDIMSLPS